MQVEVCCGNCGEFFIVETDSPELGDVWCCCPECKVEADHPITDSTIDDEVDEVVDDGFVDLDDEGGV